MSSSSSSSTIGTITVPLTTFFTPPGWCANLLYTYQQTISGTSQFIRDADGPGNGRTSSCYPPDFGVFKTGISYGIYSPAVCPSGWHATTIPHSEVSPTVSWSMCCPTGFTANLYPNTGWSCQSTVTTPTTVVLAENTFVKTSGKILVADWPIFIAWQSSDLNRFTPASAPLLTAAPKPVSSTSSIPSRTKAPVSTKSPQKTSGTSTDTEIGIGVGVSVGALAIIIILIAWLVKRKRRQRVPREAPAETPAETVIKHKHSELDGQGIFESGVTTPYRAELPTSWHGHEM